MGGWPNDSEAKKCLHTLEDEFGWSYHFAGPRAHPAGFLVCSSGELRCRIVVYGTAKNSARAIWKQASKCAHGCAPDRRQW